MSAWSTAEFTALVAQGDGTGCWLWLGRRHSKGYGWYRGRHYAHRVSYMLHVGPIPAGHVVRQRCSNRLCVNPQHLETVTPREALMRGNSFQGVNDRKTRCVHGHPLVEANIYRPPGTTWRRCKECRRATDRRRRS